MKNIFKENKKLKEENNKLKIKVNELQKENTDGLLRKKEVLKICKNLENKLNANISSYTLLDIDITTDINAYLKLLDYLKGE